MPHRVYKVIDTSVIRIRAFRTGSASGGVLASICFVDASSLRCRLARYVGITVGPERGDYRQKVTPTFPPFLASIRVAPRFKMVYADGMKQE